MRRHLFRRPLQVPDRAVILPAVAEPKPPKLRIYRGAPGWWCWDLDHGDGSGQGAAHESWGQALAVGMAALEVHSVSMSAADGRMST